MSETRNYHVIFHKRPGVDKAPQQDNFRYESCPYPTTKLEEGEVLVRTCYLSMDPALRCLMNEDPGVDYLSRWELGQPIKGSNGVGLVLASERSGLLPGDLVDKPGLGWPWALYFIADNNTPVQKLENSMFGEKPSMALIKLVGLTALIGLWEMGHVTEGANQTLVVSGASGAIGSLAGQMGRLLGCTTVVGVCGSDEKCRWLTEELGFTAAINYKSEEVASRLTSLCARGVDVYFDNVGGDISDAVIAKMNRDSHVVLCGQISQYNKDVPYPPPLPAVTHQILADRHITRERFLVLRYEQWFEAAFRQLMVWISTGQLQYHETVVEGLENTASAFISMMKGGNKGKQIVRVSSHTL